MSPNLWQYLVLLEGIGCIGAAAGLAQEALRRDPMRVVGYANVGVALISLSACANIAANLDRPPTATTWIAAAGFGLFGAGAVGSWLRALHRVVRLSPPRRASHRGV